MTIDAGVIQKYDHVRGVAKVLGAEVLELSNKVKDTSDSRFRKERTKFLERIYDLRRETDAVKGAIKGEIGRIAKKEVPEVQRFALDLQQKGNAINQLEAKEQQLLRRIQANHPVSQQEIDKITEMLNRIRREVVQEELERDALIEKYQKGDRPNDDIKTLSGATSKLDKILDALTKLESNLGY